MNLDYGILISIGSLLTVLLTAIRLLAYLTTKAREEGVKDQKLTELTKDLEGIGKKVTHIETEHRVTSDKVIELESKILTKLEGFEAMLKEHLASHTGKG